MADLPEPVDMTTSVSRPARTASIASRCPGRSASKPKVSRATTSIGGVNICTSADSPKAGQLTPARVIHLATEIPPAAVSGPARQRRPSHLEDVLLQPVAREERDEERHQRVHQQ